MCFTPRAHTESVMTKVLFVCGQGRLRSPTAEAVFSEFPGLEVASGGLASDADVPLDGELVQWADHILVMETGHRTRLNRKFGRLLRGKRVAVLGIPDPYAYMQPELVESLKRKVAQHLRL